MMARVCMGVGVCRGVSESGCVGVSVCGGGVNSCGL